MFPTILYYTIQCCTVLYCTILYYTILYHVILYCVTLYYVNNIILYSIPRSAPETAWPRLAAARPRRCREVSEAATHPSGRSRGQRSLGSPNYAVNIEISILGVAVVRRS